jgi:hypothetical protein
MTPFYAVTSVLLFVIIGLLFTFKLAILLAFLAGGVHALDAALGV